MPQYTIVRFGVEQIFSHCLFYQCVVYMIGFQLYYKSAKKTTVVFTPNTDKHILFQMA